MEILDKLKSMVGVGAPTIDLVPAAPARAGELLRGILALRGGEYDTAVTDIAVHLDEMRVVYTAPTSPELQFWRRVAEVVIVLDGRTLAAGELLELPFELVMPVDLQPSGAAVRYQLVANTEVPGLNPRTERTIEVA
jgi:sporulation-control protein spo0M